MGGRGRFEIHFFLEVWSKPSEAIILLVSYFFEKFTRPTDEFRTQYCNNSNSASKRKSRDHSSSCCNADTRRALIILLLLGTLRQYVITMYFFFTGAAAAARKTGLRLHITRRAIRSDVTGILTGPAGRARAHNQENHCSNPLLSNYYNIVVIAPGDEVLLLRRTKCRGTRRGGGVCIPVQINPPPLRPSAANNVIIIIRVSDIAGGRVRVRVGGAEGGLLWPGRPRPIK